MDLELFSLSWPSLPPLLFMFVAALWAMVIRRKDAEADADADAETQMNVDFEAGGSSTDAYWHQLGSSWEAEFLLGSPKAEQASPIQSRVTFSLDLFILVCASVRFWHYGKASLKSCKGLSHSSRS